MKKKNLMVLVFPILALILELLPWGVVMSFANPNGEPWIKKTSYFDLVPFGYANFGPLLTAILTCVLLVVCIIYVVKNDKALLKAGLFLSVIAAVTSFLPLLFSTYTIIGGAISACLIFESVLLIFSQKP